MVKERRTAIIFKKDIAEAITDYLIKMGYKREEIATFNSDLQTVTVNLMDIDKNEPNEPKE
jgi:hypothetical protein